MTMDLVRSVLTDGFTRINEGIPLVLEGLTADEIRWQPDAEANSIGWLLWHLTRQQDAQLAHLVGTGEVWESAGWRERFDLPYDADAHGYGQNAADVAKFSATDPALFTGYHDDTHRLTTDLIDGLTPEALERVIDRNWDPPVTAAVRIVSVLDDAAKHLGQAEYVKGLIERRR